MQELIVRMVPQSLAFRLGIGVVIASIFPALSMTPETTYEVSANGYSRRYRGME